MCDAVTGTNGSSARSWLGLSAILSALICTISLTHSMELGRLSFLPTYDDIIYMTHSLRIANSAYDEGLVAALLLGIRDGHSGLLSVIGGAGFLMFGRHDFSPYIPLFLLLVCVLLLAGRVIVHRAFASVLLFLMLGFLPLLQISIAEFRPDIFWGLFITYGAYKFFFGWDPLRCDRRNFWEAPLVFAAGSLLKPSAFIASFLFLLSVATIPVALSMIAALSRVYPHAEIPRVRGSLLYSIRFVVIAVLAQLPVLIPRSRSIVEYTIDALITNRELWGPSLSVSETLLFYPKLLSFVFSYGLAALALFWVATIDLAIRTRELRPVAMCLGAGAIILIGYAIPTLPRNKSIFLGAPFYGALFWSLPFLYCTFRQWADSFGVWRVHKLGMASGSAAELFLVLLAILALATRTLDRSAILSRKSPELVALDRDRRAILAAVTKIALEQSNPLVLFPAREGLSLYMNTVGPFDHDLYRYTMMKLGLPSRSVPGDVLGREDSNREAARALSADIVVLPEHHARGLERQFAGEKHVDAINDVLSSSREFVALRPEEYGQPKAIRIYVRRSAVSRVYAGSGWGSAEGPYPEWHLPVVRWMRSPAAEIVIEAAPQLTSYVIECQTAGEHAWSVYVNDQLARTARTDGNFGRIEVPLNAGNRISARLVLDDPTGQIPGAFALCRFGGYVLAE